MSPFVQPANKILAGGMPVYEELIAENTGGSDDLKPGMAAIRGTADHQVKFAGAAAVNCIGVVDYDAKYPITDAFKVSLGVSPVRVISGPCVVKMTLANTENVTKGDKLMCAANGEVGAYPATPALGDEEKIIGWAAESVDASGGAEPILVRLVI